MKRNRLLFGTIFTLFIVGCNTPVTSHPLPTTAPTKGVTVSDCQTNKSHRTNSFGKSIDNRHTYISYQYQNGTLFLTHHNVVFNCDKRGIGATSKVEGNTIIITERQTLPKGGGMRCACLFDVSIAVDNIEAKRYNLNFDDGHPSEVYLGIDLSRQNQGFKSFERHNYPYAQESMDEIVAEVPISTPHQEVFLPRQKSRPFMQLQSRISGILTNHNGCLRINGELIVFPYNASVKEKAGESIIYNMEDEVIATVGKKVAFGGFTLSNTEGESHADEKIKKISSQLPNSRCSQPYFVVHSLL